MYVKIFQDILDSSIWEEDLATRVVWITMLIMADADGVVRASLSGIKRRAGVSHEEARRAMDVLTGPDMDSKDQNYAGRRVERIQGGWEVLNYQKYREIRTKKQLQDVERQRRHRDKERDLSRVSREVTTIASASAYVGNGEGGGDRKDSQGKALVVGDESAVAVLDTVAIKADTAKERKKQLEAGAYMVFMYFNAALGKRKLWNDKVKTRLVTRLRENGCNVSELFYAIDGAKCDDWIMGRADGSRGYQNVQTIFRDREQVERFLDLVPNQDETHPTFREMMNAG